MPEPNCLYTQVVVTDTSHNITVHTFKGYIDRECLQKFKYLNTNGDVFNGSEHSNFDNHPSYYASSGTRIYIADKKADTDGISSLNTYLKNIYPLLTKYNSIDLSTFDVFLLEIKNNTYQLPGFLDDINPTISKNIDISGNIPRSPDGLSQYGKLKNLEISNTFINPFDMVPWKYNDKVYILAKLNKIDYTRLPSNYDNKDYGYKNNSWVEISTKNVDYYTYIVKGSGIFYNIKTTRSYANKIEAAFSLWNEYNNKKYNIHNTSDWNIFVNEYNTYYYNIMYTAPLSYDCYINNPFIQSKNPDLRVTINKLLDCSYATNNSITTIGNILKIGALAINCSYSDPGANLENVDESTFAFFCNKFNLGTGADGAFDNELFDNYMLYYAKMLKINTVQLFASVWAGYWTFEMFTTDGCIITNNSVTAGYPGIGFSGLYNCSYPDLSKCQICTKKSELSSNGAVCISNNNLYSTIVLDGEPLRNY